MAGLRHFSRKILKNLRNDNHIAPNSYIFLSRTLSYSSKEYEDSKNPAPFFFNSEVQSILKTLTRPDLSKIFKKKKLENEKPVFPTYKFMTDEELQKSIAEAQEKANIFLQMPPVVPVRKPIESFISRDPALEGLETCRLVFTDITFGLKDKDRLIVVREPNGDLREAEWELRDRINEVYFPKAKRLLQVPKMFEDKYLESLLNRQEYTFILDAACAQFEPDDPKYQHVVSITYQHINDNHGFDSLRSTRHFGTLTFFLVWHQNIDNLLLELIETAHINEADTLLKLYSKIHSVQFEDDGEHKALEDYIKKCSHKRSALELALQAYKELEKQRLDLETGVKAAHGIS